MDENKPGTQTARVFNQTVNIYSQSMLIDRVENCFAYMFTNIGDTIATVNDMVVFPSSTPNAALGDSRTIGGHVLDIYKGSLKLSFIQPINGNPKIEIVQLFYADKIDVSRQQK